MRESHLVEKLSELDQLLDLSVQNSIEKHDMFLKVQKKKTEIERRIEDREKSVKNTESLIKEKNKLLKKIIYENSEYLKGFNKDYECSATHFVKKKKELEETYYKYQNIIAETEDKCTNMFKNYKNMKNELKEMITKSDKLKDTIIQCDSYIQDSDISILHDEISSYIEKNNKINLEIDTLVMFLENKDQCLEKIKDKSIKNSKRISSIISKRKKNFADFHTFLLNLNLRIARISEIFAEMMKMKLYHQKIIDQKSELLMEYKTELLDIHQKKVLLNNKSLSFEAKRSSSIASGYIFNMDIMNSIHFEFNISNKMNIIKKKESYFIERYEKYLIKLLEYMDMCNRMEDTHSNIFDILLTSDIKSPIENSETDFDLMFHSYSLWLDDKQSTPIMLLVPKNNFELRFFDYINSQKSMWTNEGNVKENLNHVINDLDDLIDRCSFPSVTFQTL